MWSGTDIIINYSGTIIAIIFFSRRGEKILRYQLFFWESSRDPGASRPGFARSENEEPIKRTTVKHRKARSDLIDWELRRTCGLRKNRVYALDVATMVTFAARWWEFQERQTDAPRGDGRGHG